jgi:exodeoxyribonuclease V alpha subunit
MFCVFNTFGIVSAYPIERLESFEPAFAITVHKSQGSEYDHILFIVPELISKTLLTREILYTGITRAKKSIIVFASDEVLGHAIQNRIERESGMGIV